MVLVIGDSALMLPAGRSLRKSRPQHITATHTAHPQPKSSASTVFQSLSPGPTRSVHPSLVSAFTESICIRPAVPTCGPTEPSDDGVTTSTRSTLLYSSRRYLQKVQLTLRPLVVTHRSLQLLHTPEGQPFTRQTVHLGGQWVVSDRANSERDDPESQPVRFFTSQVSRRGMEKRFRCEVNLPLTKLLTSADSELTSLADHIRRQRYHLCERFFLLNINNNESTVPLSVFRSIAAADCQPSSARDRRQRQELQQKQQKLRKQQLKTH